MTDDSILIRIEMLKSGRVYGLMGADFGTDRAIAESVLRLAMPMISRVTWAKHELGWAFEGQMQTFKLPGPAPAAAAAPQASAKGRKRGAKASKGAK